MRRLFVPAAYFVLGTLALGLIVLNVLAFSGQFADGESSAPPRTSRPQPPPPPAPSPSSAPEPIATTRPRERARPATTLTIDAARGDCWVEVRAGSASGKLLYSGLLAAGNSLRFHRDKVWLRLGAASHVDVLVNGRPSTVPPGTVELVVPTQIG